MTNDYEKWLKAKEERKERKLNPQSLRNTKKSSLKPTRYSPSLRNSQPLKKKNKNAGRNNIIYKLAWEKLPHKCAECGKPLLKYSARYCSHYLPKSVYINIAGDLENMDLLCQPGCHDRWGAGDAKNMRIWSEERRNYLIKKDYELSRLIA